MNFVSGSRSQISILMELKQETLFQSYLEQKVEKGTTAKTAEDNCGNYP